MARALIASLLALMLTACGGGGNPLPSAQAQTSLPLIVVIGDSLTAAYMPADGARLRLAPELAYTAELRPMGKVITSAVGGATTQAARSNQLHWLAPLTPDVVVVLLGTNDAALQLDRAQALANVEAITSAWPRARLVLVAPPRWDAATDPWMLAWSQDLRRLATARGAEFVDGYAASVATNWQCSTEDFHPCADAHRALGAMVSTAARTALQKGA